MLESAIDDDDIDDHTLWLGLFCLHIFFLIHFCLSIANRYICFYFSSFELEPSGVLEQYSVVKCAMHVKQVNACDGDLLAS